MSMPASGFASIVPPVHPDGLLYANSIPLTNNEADLFGGSGAQGTDPIPVLYGQAVSAIVTLQPSGLTGTVNSYVIMQTDWGDGNWFDVCGIVYTNPQAPGYFVLSAGVAGNNAFQQTRQAGSFPTPQTNFSNQMALGGRIRFVGKALISGSSSAVSGGIWQMAATIRYRFTPLR